ncbi:glutamine-rich protein 2 [Elysia marginata]|uniref:Glutamine-rich protein 2 n=1 Tax=Elysia marginata TaxID=1093978 RepID=A0AAV4HX44_9GAST|nr:glutamine-rich protein 2 [Elysia marginata]
MIRDILDKLNGQDGDWKSALAKAMEELDGKLDRREMNNLKEWLEKQLKALNNKIKSMGPGFSLDEEAAGMKKQLIQHFNCLSCDKPLDVMPHPPIASIPANYGMPKSRSPRPYTTFELDQIRQHARSLGVNPEMVDYYATIRQCGGSHTLTHPQKRITRLNNLGQILRDDETVVPLYKEEVDVQGADGHIYKGRMEATRLEAKLPSMLSSQQPQPIYMERQQTQSPQPPQRLLAARVPRPTSGRPGSSQSGRSGQRFHTAAMTNGRSNEDVAAPENSQAEGSRTTTPQQDVTTAIEIVQEENLVDQQEDEVDQPAQQAQLQEQLEEGGEQQAEEPVERPKSVDAQNSTEDKD